MSVYAGVPLDPAADEKTAVVDKLINELKVIQADVTLSAKNIAQVDAAVEKASGLEDKEKQQELVELADAVRAELDSLEGAAKQTAEIRYALDALAARTKAEIRPGKRGTAGSRYPIFELRLQQAYQLLMRVDEQIHWTESSAFKVLEKIRDAQRATDADIHGMAAKG